MKPRIGACCHHGPSQVLSHPVTNRMPTPPDARKVIVGVDTYKHVHVAAAIDSWGIRLRDQAFVADSGGYQALIHVGRDPRAD